MRWLLLVALLVGCDETDAGLGDAATHIDSQTDPDMSPVDGPVDTDAAPDVRLVDGHLPDAAATDGPDLDGPTLDAEADAPDAELPDGPVPDLAPDGPPPDGPPPDGPPPDGPSPDAPQPDAAPPPPDCDVLFRAEFEADFPGEAWALEGDADLDPWSVAGGRVGAINGVDGLATAIMTTATFVPPFTITATFRQSVAGDGGVHFRLPGEDGVVEAVARVGAPSSVGDVETAAIARGVMVHARLQVEAERVVFALLDAEEAPLGEPAVHARRFVEGTLAVALGPGAGGVEVERLRVVPGSHEDASVRRSPTGVEVCDSRDNDCDGVVDEAEQDAPNLTPVAVSLDRGTAGAPAGFAYDPVRDSITLAYTENARTVLARAQLLEFELHDLLAGPTQLGPDVTHALSDGGRAAEFTGTGVTVVFSARLPDDDEGGRWSVRLTHSPHVGDLRSAAVTTRRRRVIQPRMVWTGEAFGITWVEVDGGVGFARAGANMRLLGEVHVFEPPEGRTWVQPDLTATDTGFVLVWTEDTGAAGTILLQRIGADGIPAGEPAPVTDGASAAFPSVAWNGTELGVAFDDVRDEHRAVYFKRVTADGRPIEPELRLAEGDLLELDAERPTLRWSGREFGVLWRGATPGVDQGADRYFMRIGADGQPCSHQTRLTDDGQRKGGQSMRWVGGRWMVVHKSWANPDQRSSVFSGPFAGCPPPAPEDVCPPVILDR